MLTKIDFLIYARTLSLLVMVWVLGAAAPDPRVHQWVSPDGTASIVSTKSRRDGEFGYDLTLVRSGFAPVLIDEYLRAVDVIWSADSTFVAITDWIGSNVADCFVINKSKPRKSVSMTSLLPKLPFNLANAHLYVSCPQWQSSKTLRVRVTGHTDSPPSHQFAYKFMFDVRRMRLIPLEW